MQERENASAQRGFQEEEGKEDSARRRAQGGKGTEVSASTRKGRAKEERATGGIHVWDECTDERPTVQREGARRRLKGGE